MASSLLWGGAAHLAKAVKVTAGRIAAEIGLTVNRDDVDANDAHSLKLRKLAERNMSGARK